MRILGWKVGLKNDEKRNLGRLKGGSWQTGQWLLGPRLFLILDFWILPTWTDGFPNKIPIIFLKSPFLARCKQRTLEWRQEEMVPGMQFLWDRFWDLHFSAIFCKFFQFPAPKKGDLHHIPDLFPAFSSHLYNTLDIWPSTSGVVTTKRLVVSPLTVRFPISTHMQLACRKNFQ